MDKCTHTALSDSGVNQGGPPQKYISLIYTPMLAINKNVLHLDKNSASSLCFSHRILSLQCRFSGSIYMKTESNSVQMSEHVTHMDMYYMVHKE